MSLARTGVVPTTDRNPAPTMSPPHIAQHVRNERCSRAGQVAPSRARRRWGPLLLTALAAAFVLGGLVRLATDDRVVEVVSFHEPDQVAPQLAAALAAEAGEER